MSERALRLFVALELPAEAAAALQRFPVDVDVWRRVPPESLHVTLAFLGQTAPALVPAVADALAGETDAPALELAGALLLPPRRPRVLCAALADPSGAPGGELQARVASRLAETGAFTPETRRFRPHVTVARLRPHARAPRRVDAELDPVAFAGTAVTLFSSLTSPHGARYEALARVPLSPGRTAD